MTASTRPGDHCYICESAVEDEALAMWVDDDGFHYDAPSNVCQSSSDSFRICASCHRTYTAILDLKAYVETDISPPVRVSGYLVSAWDRGSLFDEPEQFSEMRVDNYRPGPSYGNWSFCYYPNDNAVIIQHHFPIDFTPDGQFRTISTLVAFEVSADQWRSKPVDVVATFLGREIATTAAPMLQLPSTREVDQILSKERDWLLARLDEQDQGSRERSDDFLVTCWARGAISWNAVELYRDTWEDGDTVCEWDDEKLS